MKHVAFCLSVMAVVLACNRPPKLSNEDAFLLVGQTRALDSAWYIDLNLGERKMPRPSSGFRMLREDGYLRYADPDVNGYTFVSLTNKSKLFVVPGADSSRLRVGIPISWKVLSVSDTLEDDRRVKVVYVKVLLDSVSPFSVCQYNFDTVMLYVRKFIDLNGKWVDHGGGYVGPLQMTMDEAKELAVKYKDVFENVFIPKDVRGFTKIAAVMLLAKRGYLNIDSSSGKWVFVTVTGKGMEFIKHQSDVNYYEVKTVLYDLGKRIEIENVVNGGHKQTVLSYWYELRDSTPFSVLRDSLHSIVGFKCTYQRVGWDWRSVHNEVY